ncbi:MAG: HDIG domain-containing protein [FCB group bacterium]|nr:HDIG domain-containing protein [FCB group bacterium]MBL7027767.1 HDIG domain-containing protein [Candidatus Neomarinimicrobiota bacterium]MBL7120848.1 HDIG domain-containing protein [Candidatus Neomarinimicrobiota bacterium]
MLPQSKKVVSDEKKYHLWLRISQITLIALLLVVTALFFPRGKMFQFDYAVDQITTETIIAPFDFDILKTSEALETDRNARESTVQPVFIWDNTSRDKVNTAIDEMRVQLALWYQAEKGLAAKRNYWSTLTDTLAADSMILQLQEDSLHVLNIKLDLQNRGLKNLGTPRWDYFLEKGPSTWQLVNSVKQALLPQYMLGIIGDLPPDIDVARITMIMRGKESSRNPKDFRNMEQSWEGVQKVLSSNYFDRNPSIQQLAEDIAFAVMIPNLNYSAELTDNRIAEARNLVPISVGKVFKNERIVDANTRVTPQIKQKLNSMEKEYIRKGYGESAANKVTTFMGKIMLSAFLLFFFFAYLQTYRSQIYNDIKLIALVGVIFIMHLALAHLIVYKLGWSEFFVPMSIAAMIFTVVFDGRIAFIIMVTLTLLTGIILSNNIPFIVANLFVSSLAIYTVRRLRSRTQILWSILAVTSGYVAVIAVFEMIKFSNWESVMEHMVFAAANGILSPLLSYGLLVLIERVFKITTNLTLLELLDFNNKLLSKLAMKAPGTFKHSIDVGNLAVAASEAVGANSLLARVGAYYHDIGKAEKPEYFIENQLRGTNKHDKLSPRLSATVIVAHVKDGIKLADENRLPSIVADFIPMHHGKTRVEYFYQQALEKAKETDSDINESDFRYPGPRPNTKETGILMIAEAVEAASRSLKNPNPQRLESLMNTIIESRIKGGELINCPLTFRDLEIIKSAMMPVLTGSMHERIEYPGQREKLHIMDDED